MRRLEVAFTFQQQEAIERVGDKFAIVASAGAGKTTVLVERYLRYIVDLGYSPDEILCTTFTKKAAAEMKQRVVRRLRESGLFAQAQIAETGPIQTMHSFCERTLRENALEAGLPPDFLMGAGAEAREIMEKAIHEAIANANSEMTYATDVVRLVAGTMNFSSGADPYKVLINAVREIMETVRASGLSRQEFEERHRDPGTLRSNYEQMILGLVGPGVAERVHQLSGHFYSRMAEALKSDYKNPMRSIFRSNPVDDEADLRFTVGLVELVCRAWYSFSYEMNRANLVDYTGLEERVLRLLRTSNGVQERLATQYRVALIDEAQDLSQMQHQIVRLLQLQQVIMIGDAQQSIYRFRHADVREFETWIANDQVNLPHNHRSEPGIVRFVNHVFGQLWRDRYNVMESPFALPKANPEDPFQSENFDGIEIWQCADSAGQSEVCDQIERLLVEHSPSEIAVLLPKNRIAEMYQEALTQRGIPAQIIGGSATFLARLEVRDLVNSLRALGDPTDRFAFAALLLSPAVDVSLDACVIVMGRIVSALDLGTLLELEDLEWEDKPKLEAFWRWYEPLQRVSDRLSAFEALSRLVCQSSLMTNLALRNEAKRRLANTRKMLMIAGDHPDQGPIEFANYVNDILSLDFSDGEPPQHDGQGGYIQLMTYHKAKGLEFPVVVLPSLGVKNQGFKKAYQFEPKSGLLSTNYVSTKYPIFAAVETFDQIAERKDQERLMYVACTRAKKKLCLALYPATESGDTWSKSFRALLGPEINNLKTYDSNLVLQAQERPSFNEE